MMNSIDNFDYVAYRDGTIDGEMLYIIQYMVAANNADKMLGGLVAGGGGVATGTIVTPEGYLVEVELSGGYAGVAENIGSMVAEGALSGVLAMNGQGGPNKGDSKTGNTKHGDQRLKERGFTDEKVTDIMENYSQKVYQDGGRTVYAKKNGNYYDVIITNADGEIVTAVGGNTKSLKTWKDVTKILNNNGGYSTLPY